jgi:repressor LexA
VLARQQESAQQGEIVVAVIGEEATVKRYYQEGAQVKLMPENDAYEPILVGGSEEPFRIAGKIVGLMRRF